MIHSECVWQCVCLCVCVVAVNHLRFISSVTTSQTLWRAIMLYQQINDLAITGHNWLWNKGYNILSVSLQLFNTRCSSLLLVLLANSTCPLFTPYSYSPTSSSPSSEHFPQREPTAPSFPLSFERGIWKTGLVSTSLHHVQSSLMFTQLSRPFHCPSTSLSPSSCPTRLPLNARYVSALKHSITYHSPASFHFYLSPSKLFSSPPSCLRLTPLPLTFPLCLGVFLSWEMLYNL